MSQEKKVGVKLGQLLKSKAGNDYIRLGDTNQKDEKFNYTVDIRITKANGEKVVLKNPSVFLSDPRKNAKNPEKIPSFVLSDLVFFPEDKKA